MEEQRKAAAAVLKEHWGYDDFRPGQAAVVEAVLAGRDVLAILPTGGGKSICYQVPALLQPGLTLVVSPLIALMEDQVAALRARGLPAALLNSTLTAREVEQCWTDAEFGRYKLLYLAPERLQTDLFRARAERLKVSLLAVDEAHCVSEWGHHFRPAYREIAAARALLGDPPVVALTATATPPVRRDIVELLALRDPHVLVRGFDRPNIVWSIFRTEQKRSKVLDVLRGVTGSGILYAATRRAVEEWAAWLSDQGEAATSYHGGMRAEQRTAAQAAWLAGQARVMVATNAFGMGIDKPDVRFVVHVDLPGSLEGYYQEAGRGGRDGQRAYAVLLYHPADEATHRSLINDGHPDAAVVQRVYEAVCNLAQIPMGSLPQDPVVVDVSAVARLTGFAPGRIQTAVDVLVRQETWTVLPSRRHYLLVRFRQPAEAIRRYAGGLENRALADFIETLLRSVHADAFSGWWEVDLRALSRRAKLPRERLERGLAFLAAREMLDWLPLGQAERVTFTAPRTRLVPVDDLVIRRARRRAEARLDDILRYARSVTCRRHFLLTYFGEESPARCGACDLCLGRHKAVVITPEDEPVLRQVLHHIGEGTPRADWFEGVSPARLDGIIDWLVQENYLRVAAPLEESYTLTEKAHDLIEQWAPR